MKNFEIDLSIIGHAVKDQIFDGICEPNEKWGGIYNVSRCLSLMNKKFDTKISHDIQPSSYGEALIKIDRNSSSKEIIEVNLNKTTRIPSIKKSNWYHFCYLNEIKLSKKFFELDGIKSADLCKGKEINNINQFDYIFLSSEEHDARKYSYKNKNIKFISHDPEKIEIFQGGEKIDGLNLSKPIENINCLGVGDFFAGSFIYKKLCQNVNDSEAIIFASEECRKFLLSR